MAAEKSYKRSRKLFDPTSNDGHLDFDIEILGYIGDDTWVDDVIQKAYDCLCSDYPPEFPESCEYCQHYKSIDNLKNQKVIKKEEQQLLF